MFGDVYSNRDPSPGDPSPLLTRLLIRTDDRDDDGGGGGGGDDGQTSGDDDGAGGPAGARRVRGTDGARREVGATGAAGGAGGAGCSRAQGVGSIGGGGGGPHSERPLRIPSGSVTAATVPVASYDMSALDRGADDAEGGPTHLGDGTLSASGAGSWRRNAEGDPGTGSVAGRRGGRGGDGSYSGVEGAGSRGETDVAGGGGESYVPAAGESLFREAPLLAPTQAPPSRRIYAFDPWTKVPVVIRPAPTDQELAAWAAMPWWERHRLRWCWRPKDPSWWVAFCYLVGSVGFAIGGFSSCLRAVVSTPQYFLYLEVTPYVVGEVVRRGVASIGRPSQPESAAPLGVNLSNPSRKGVRDGLQDDFFFF